MIWHQEEHPACKKWAIRCWHGYLSRARCKWFPCGPAVAAASPSGVASLKSRLVWPFWCQLMQVALVKRQLNGCLSSIDVKLKFISDCLPLFTEAWVWILVKGSLYTSHTKIAVLIAYVLKDWNYENWVSHFDVISLPKWVCEGPCLPNTRHL